MSEPFSLRLKSIIAALWTGNLLAPFLMSGVAAMLPAIGQSLAASAVELSLVMVCYNLGQTSSHLLSGRMSHIYGVKRFLLLAIAIFSLFSLFMGLTPSMEIMVGLRFGQGLTAGAMACCVTALSLTVAPPKQRGQVIGIVLTAVYLGLTVGPLACGALTELMDWRFVFFLIAALGCAVWLILHFSVPETDSSRGGRLDILGSLLVFLSLSFITIGSTCTFLHPSVRWFLPAGLVLLVIFVRHDWYSDHPLLDLRILMRVPDLPAGMAAVFVNYGSFLGLSLFYSIFLQQVLGLNPFHAGMVMMMQSVFQLLVSSTAGKLADRFGALEISSMGLFLSGSGLLCLLFLDQNSQVWHVVLCQAFLGIGVGFFAAPNMSATLGNVPKEQLSVASGLLGCLRTLGGLMSNIILSFFIGLFLGDEVVSPQNADRFLEAMHYVLLIFGGMNLMGLSLYLLRCLRKWL